MRPILFLSFLLLLRCSINVRGQSEHLVDITLGRIRGSVMSSIPSSRQFHAFRGIPYARPPIGELRFRDPVPIEPWEGVFDGSHDGPTCFQFDPFTRGFKGSEDCLVVNVYTHSLTPERGLRPVMVWIHGGGWSLGSGSGESDQYGPEYFMDRDIVLVTINYRLGPLGFLSTHDDVAPGNYGLLDQTLALKWIQEHIGQFGGDPDSVTIFGASAGGGSVHHHVLSPCSKGLFHRAIVQSGSSLCPWANLEHVDKYSKLLAENAQCPTSSSQEMVDCLRSKSVEDILDYVIKFLMETGIPVIVFGPRVDSERPVPFFPSHPRELLQTGQFNQVPLIIGMDKNEGMAMLLATGLAQGNQDRISQFQEDPVKFLIPILAVQDEADSTELTRNALNKYVTDGATMEEQLHQLEQMIADYGFFHCMDEAAQYHRQYNPTYYYMYTHRGLISNALLFGVPPTLDLGVAHTDELFLMFKHHVVPPSTFEEDKRVSKTLLDLWTSFATEGEPTSDTVPHWPTLSKDQDRYLNIKFEPEVVAEKMPFWGRLAFWDPVYRPSRNKDEL